MRVLIATYYYLPHVGGGTWYFYHIARGLADLGEQVVLLAPLVSLRLTLTTSQPQAPRGVRVVRLNRRMLPRWLGPIIPLSLFRRRSLESARHAEVLMGQYNPHHLMGLASVTLGKIVGRPVVLRVEDWRRWMFGTHPAWRTKVEWVLAGPLNRMNEWAARHADLLLVVDREAADHFRNRGATGKKIVISPNGVDFAAIRKLPDRTTLRNQLGLPVARPVAVMVGRFSGGEYGTDTLMDAFEDVHAQRPDALLVLVGDELDPSVRARHDVLIREGAVRLTGPVEQAMALQYTAAADVAIGPLGATKTAPLKVVEALALRTFAVIGRGSVDKQLEEFSSRFAEVSPHRSEVAKMLLAAFEASHGEWGKDEPRGLDAYAWETIAREVDQSLRTLMIERTARRGAM